MSVEHTEFDEVAAEAPTGFTELPTCPICLGEFCAKEDVFYVIITLNSSVPFFLISIFGI
jgi:hypothetical protein